MGKALQERIKQNKFDSVHQEALLNILVCGYHIRQIVDDVCNKYGITMTQYNVLRILKGGEPEGYPRYEILKRMLEPAPDVTRIIDRLVKIDLVERHLTKADRRLSMTRITKKGLVLLEIINPVINSLNHEIMTGAISATEATSLSELLEKVYTHQMQMGYSLIEGPTL